MALNKQVLANLTKTASILQPFGLNNFVFIGGAVVGLLITDTAAPEARTTKDVDLLTQNLSRTAFNKLEFDFRSAGFMPDADVICRWHVEDIVLDIMPPQEAVLGFSNRWYAAVLEHTDTVAALKTKELHF